MNKTEGSEGTEDSPMDHICGAVCDHRADDRRLGPVSRDGGHHSGHHSCGGGHCWARLWRQGGEVKLNKQINNASVPITTF